MKAPQVLQADLTLVGGGFEPGIQVEIDAAGKLGRIGDLGLEPTLRLERQALLPGMVNVHSHAFQRGLRGQAEVFPNKGGATFWSWRDEMYELARGLDAESFYALYVRCFSEMLRAGITTVGEFHYLHRGAAPTGDGAGNEFDGLLLSAAKQAGIRLVLLDVCYLTGDLGAPLGPVQRQFASRSTDEFFSRTEALRARLDPWTQSLGLVAHSVRAVPIEDIARIHERARRDSLVFHIHVEEQRAEIERCLKAYGMRPMELLLDRLEIGGEFTAIHCTHTRLEDLRAFTERGGHVCICPLTEANLGDGIAPAGFLWEHGGRVSLGTDSNLRIDLSEEMRLLEYAQRLHREMRGVCVAPDGHVARGLWSAATEAGAAALNVNAGVIRSGRLADLISIDLESPLLAGWSRDTLLASFIFGADGRVVERVCVGGAWV